VSLSVGKIDQIGTASKAKRAFDAAHWEDVLTLAEFARIAKLRFRGSASTHDALGFFEVHTIDDFAGLGENRANMIVP